ncbi:PA2169 family four-helix-bundle protein [Edaphobacter albus]|uniref:PA2169 family four-helix-bundle protein n=1 Tax=Edaphobacter sp. 4G125 TaxID=2763071 RepID=UPI00164653E7|nr:PA2169 family four-helix-bundle protein [Edaphobacter sp. 4G125]QNI36534.1 PA2169 family four-helix-bundle protein [Edaphobacter sp. 4G125]
MATDAAKRNEMRRALLSVINTLHDSQKAFAEIGDHLKDAAIKKYFLAESLKRAQFRGDLEEVLHQNGVHDITESGTAVGALNRVWGDLKAKLGGGDHTLLATAEQGEDTVKEAYEDALRQELPLPIRQILAEQQAHVLDSHTYVKGQRDVAVTK